MPKTDVDVEAEYEKVRPKYNLPGYKELNKEFELDHIEHKNFILRSVRRRMNDKLIFFCRIIEGVLYPHEKSPLNAYESSFFDEEKKEQLTVIHKRMMIFERQSLLLDVNTNEEEDVEYIRKIYKEWKGFKDQVSTVVKTMEESWQAKLPKEEEGEYFG